MPYTHRSVDLGTLVIANGEQNSSSMNFRKWRSGARKIGIYGPAELDGTIKVQVSEDDSTWFDYQEAGADVAIPADGYVTLKNNGFKYLRVVSSGAETPARTFTVKGEEGY